MMDVDEIERVGRMPWQSTFAASYEVFPSCLARLSRADFASIEVPTEFFGIHEDWAMDELVDDHYA